MEVLKPITDDQIVPTDETASQEKKQKQLKQEIESNDTVSEAEVSVSQNENRHFFLKL